MKHEPRHMTWDLLAQVYLIPSHCCRQGVIRYRSEDAFSPHFPNATFSPAHSMLFWNCRDSNPGKPVYSRCLARKPDDERNSIQPQSLERFFWKSCSPHEQRLSVGPQGRIQSTASTNRLEANNSFQQSIAGKWELSTFPSHLNTLCYNMPGRIYVSGCASAVSVPVATLAFESFHAWAGNDEPWGRCENGARM
jgi:hypothetical protein